MKKFWNILTVPVICIIAISSLFVTGCKNRQTPAAFIPEDITGAGIIDGQSEPLLPKIITDFSSSTDNGTVNFGWKTVTDKEYDSVRVSVSTPTENQIVFINRNDKSWQYNMENDTLYTFNFTPFNNGEAAGQSVFASRYINTDTVADSFPRVEINTQDCILPDCNFIAHPENGDSIGFGITDNNYVQSVVKLYNDNQLVYDSSSGQSAGQEYKGSKIKLRGNTSAYFNKKPYKIKLNKKADLLSYYTDRTDGKSYADKEWLLLASQNNLNTVVSFAVNKQVNMDWTPSYTYVTLYLNGDYRGIYMLCESVKQGNGSAEKQARCAVEDDGFIVELDAYWWKEDIYFETPLTVKNRFKYTFKHPDTDDFTKNDDCYKYIRKYFSDAEAAILDFNSMDYLNYIDSETFAKWLIVHDVLGTSDVGGSNMYFTKKTSTSDSKIRTVTVWDFDSICNTTDHFSNHRLLDDTFYYYLWRRPEFTSLYKSVYEEVKSDLLNAVNNSLAPYNTDVFNRLLLLDGKISVDIRYDGITVPQLVSDYNEFFAARLNWLNNAVSAL